MKSNFDFLKDIDLELFCVIEDAQKLFLDEYFNQSVIQVRIFAEKIASRIVQKAPEDTFDDVLQGLKDKVQSEREREFVEDLFFIKKEGNRAAHGETLSVSEALEILKRAFETSINYADARGYKKANKLLFDTNLLITGQTKKEKIKEKIKEAKKNLKENINNQKFDSTGGTKDSKNAKKSDKLKSDKLKKSDKHGLFDKSDKKDRSAKSDKPNKAAIASKDHKTLNDHKTSNASKASKPSKTPNGHKTSKQKAIGKCSKGKKEFVKPILFLLFVLLSLFFLLKMFCLF